MHAKSSCLSLRPLAPSYQSVVCLSFRVGCWNSGRRRAAFESQTLRKKQTTLLLLLIGWKSGVETKAVSLFVYPLYSQSELGTRTCSHALISSSPTASLRIADVMRSPRLWNSRGKKYQLFLLLKSATRRLKHYLEQGRLKHAANRHPAATSPVHISEYSKWLIPQEPHAVDSYISPNCWFVFSFLSTCFLC